MYDAFTNIINNNDKTIHTDTEPTVPETFCDHYDWGGFCFSMQEIGMYQLIELCDSVNAPLGFYDRLIAMIRKLKKTGFDIYQAKY